MPPLFAGEVPLKLSDGREFTLTFNNETLFEAEIASGKPLKIFMLELGMEFFGAIRVVLLVALRPKHPEIKIEDCSDMMMGGDLDVIEAAIKAGFTASHPDASQSEGKDGENPPRGRGGTRSGRSGAKSASTRRPSGKQPRALSK
jgi:hypothetical protein